MREVNFPTTFREPSWVPSSLVLRALHGVRGKFTDDVSGAVVGPIFTGSYLELIYVLTKDH